MSQEDDGQHAQHKTTLRQLYTIKNDSQKEQGIRIYFSNNENEKRQEKAIKSTHSATRIGQKRFPQDKNDKYDSTATVGHEKTRFPRQAAHTLRVILIGELFLQIFDIFFAQFFNLPYFPVFSPKYWNVNEFDMLRSGEFHE